MKFDSGENDDFLTLKMHGNTYMKDKQYLKAIKRYTTALSKLPSLEHSSDEDIKNRLITLSNRAEGFLKLGYFYSSLKDCEEILEKNKIIKNLILKTKNHFFDNSFIIIIIPHRKICFHFSAWIK